MGVLDRLLLSDEQWERMSGLIIGRADQRGSTGRDNRMFVEGVLWIVRTARPARSARGVRRMEQRLPALQPMERKRRVAADVRSDVRRSRL